MKKKFFIIATLCLLYVSCQSRDFRGYGYNTVYNPPRTTYANYNTATGGVKGASTYYPGSYSYQYYTPYTYYPYTYNNYYPYTYKYSYPYTYNYYTPYLYGNHYRPIRWRNFLNHCSLAGSKLNFSLETPDGVEHRNIADENLRAQTFGKRTEVQYGNENEKLNFFTNEVGKTFVSGKVFVEDTLITLDPKKHNCTSTRGKLKDDPDNEIARFNCSDGNNKITAEVLIPNDQQNPDLALLSQKK
jgi:hypothetical protein